MNLRVSGGVLLLGVNLLCASHAPVFAQEDQGAAVTTIAEFGV